MKSSVRCDDSNIKKQYTFNSFSLIFQLIQERAWDINQAIPVGEKKTSETKVNLKYSPLFCRWKKKKDCIEKENRGRIGADGEKLL